MTPASKRSVVAELNTHWSLSERRSCELVGISRSSYHYRTQPRCDAEIRSRLCELASKYPRYGYLLLYRLLREAGFVVNKKRVHRIYKEAGLQVPKRKRNKLCHPRCVPTTPARVNECWSMDFVHDQLSDGRYFRVLNIVDNSSRQCVGQIVDVSITGQRVANYLSELIEWLGVKPVRIVCDNGTEFRCKAMFHWSRDRQVELDFIQPGKPTRNAFVESFNGKFRDGCLNQFWFRSIKEAREIIEDWRIDYNEVRPHSALGYQPPSVFAEAIV